MKFNSSFHSKYSSFALIEILVVVSIIIILSVIVITNYELGGYQFSVKRSTHKLSQDLRRVEEMAMSAKAFKGSVPAGGYGIHLNHHTGTYILFADKNESGFYEELEDELVETLNTEENVEIGQLCKKPDPPCSCEGSLNIIFIPPDPIIKLNNSIATTCSAEINLRSKKTDDEMFLYLRPTGLIEISLVELEE